MALPVLLLPDLKLQRIQTQQIRRLKLFFEVSTNPNHGRFIVKSSSEDYNGAILKVYNSMEKIIYQTIGDNNLNEIDLSNHPNAVYYLTLQSKTEI